MGDTSQTKEEFQIVQKMNKYGRVCDHGNMETAQETPRNGIRMLHNLKKVYYTCSQKCKD